MINLQPLKPVEIQTPFGPITVPPGVTYQFLFPALKAIADAIDAREQGSSTAFCDVPTMTSTVTIQTPFGPQTVTPLADVVALYAAIKALGDGIDADWGKQSQK